MFLDLWAAEGVGATPLKGKEVKVSASSSLLLSSLELSYTKVYAP